MTDKIDFGGKPWTAIPRHILRDKSLSPKAKGGLVTLLSHEEGWLRSSMATLQRESRCGRTEARSIMRELVDKGYATMSQQHGAGGRFTTFYTVHAIRRVQGVEAVNSPGAETRGAVPPGAVELSTVVEPPDVHPQSLEPKALAPATPMRARDPVWDALTEAFGEPTASGRGAMNAAGKVLRDYGATPDDIRWMARELQGTDVSWAVATPSALAKHFGERHRLFAETHHPSVYDHAAAIANGDA